MIYLSDHRVETNPIFKTLYIPIYAKKLEKFLTVEDTVISFMERANFVNILSKPKHKTIISLHTIPFARNEFHPYLFLMKFFYPEADSIITVSKQLEFRVKNFLKVEKIKTIYNPIEIEEIINNSKLSLEEYSFFKKFPYLINVGRLTKAKGQWYLLRIFKQLKRKYKDLKFVILGKGELKNYLVELSQNLGLKTYVWDRDKLNETYDVYFLGFQKNPYKFIKHSKVFVFTSLWEGFGNAIVESLAVGKTVISTDCKAGPREILAPKTDFLFETQKPSLEEFGILMPNFERRLLKADDPLTSREKVWIDTLLEVLNNEKLLREYERKAPIRAKDFSIEKIIPLWKEVIEQ